MTIDLAKSRLVAALTLSVASVGSLQAAPPAATAKGNTGPTVQTILAFQPVAKDVSIDRPEGSEIAKCSISMADNNSGYILRTGDGEILRIFRDTNNDRAVDQWSYFKDGGEVYRDIDTNKNERPDQCRWLNTAGTRWGIDTNEDGKIDQWKTISAEEVTAELVAALRDHDRARFERLLVSPKEIKALGLSEAKSQALAKKLEAATTGFAKFAAGQKLVTRESKWVSFGGFQPGIVPQGTEDSTADLMVYENVMAMVENDGKAQPLTVGALVRVGSNWRLIDLPLISEDTASANDYKPFFFAMPKVERADQQVNKPNEKMQQLMSELQNLGEITADTPPKTHERRVELLTELAEMAETPEMRAQWYQNLADMLSAAVQTGGYDAGIDKLKTLHDTLAADGKDEALAFYVKFRWLTAEHGQELAKPQADFAVIQKKWIADLTELVNAGKKYPDSADAMMELAIAQEFGGDETEALKWYDTIARDFPSSQVHRKAAGAKLRLTSVGKPIPLKGKMLNGAGAFDLSAHKGKAVLIQYWATWCEPCKADMPLLKELRSKFGKEFEVVGVCLDQDKKDAVSFLKQNDPRWPQLFEEGGLDSPLANELGIQTLPTMILVDKDGKVVNRNIRAQELEGELKKILK